MLSRAKARNAANRYKSATIAVSCCVCRFHPVSRVPERGLYPPTSTQIVYSPVSQIRVLTHTRREYPKFRTSRISPLMRQRHVTTRRTARRLCRSTTPAKRLLTNELSQNGRKRCAQNSRFLYKYRKTQKAAPRGTAFPLLAINGLLIRAGQPRQRGKYSSGFPLAGCKK
jgi:hypothetical protein